ncbi:L,D-transpeptidase [Candidatus Pacearchaeota archaeon]|nr:L,D-transpeptidase [Candidatus Pacearchaeota archaeon]
MIKKYLAITLFSLIGILPPSKIVQENFSQPKKSGLEIKFESLDERYHANIGDYLVFTGQIKNAIETSRKNKSPLIIVDKSEYKLQVYNSGKLTDSFPIELGANPFDDKTKEWDGCTPEGFYEISSKKSGKATAFYKALLINYPNEEDKIKFEKLKLEGKIKKKELIGGDIEIHGYGSGFAGNKEGYNWTAGCITLSNDKMDLLFSKIDEGTKILIVKYKTELISDFNLSSSHIPSHKYSPYYLDRNQHLQE